MEFVYAREAPGVPPQAALERASLYLTTRGYRPSGGAPEEPRFVRGRPLAGLYTMSRMDRLRTRVAVTARASRSGSELGLRYDVDTFGQLITATNRAFWDVEVDELLDRVCERDVPDRWAAWGVRARRDALRFALTSLAIAIACGLVAYVTGWFRFVHTQ